MDGLYLYCVKGASVGHKEWERRAQAWLMRCSWTSAGSWRGDQSSWPQERRQWGGLQRLCRVLWPQKTLLSSNDPIGKDIHNPLPHHFYFPFSIWRKSSPKTPAYVKKRRWLSASCEKDIYWIPTKPPLWQVFAECMYRAHNFNNRTTSIFWLLNSV